jgi:lactoylglutathione lyase
VGVAANKALVGRLMDVVEARHYDAVEDLVTEDFINHAAGAACAAAWKRIFTAIVGSFPDAHYTVDDMIAEDDKVVVVATMRGTHQASTFPALNGIEPTGSAVKWHFIHIFRVADGRIAEHWAQRNDMEVLRSLAGEVGTSRLSPDRAG